MFPVTSEMHMQFQEMSPATLKILATNGRGIDALNDIPHRERSQRSLYQSNVADHTFPPILIIVKTVRF